MCTAIAKKGNDLLYGFNLDIDPSVWHYALYQNDNLFSVGITVGKTVYYTHGVNRNGCFGNVPYMNGEAFTVPHGARRERIDLMCDRYLRGKYSYRDLEEILRTRVPVNVPAVTLHSLFGNERGELLIVEPGYGFRKVEEDFAVLTNFPVLADQLKPDNPFYGMDRYRKASEILQNSGKDFSADDAMTLLSEVKQEGTWATRVSFVYSRNENAVRYCLDGDFSHVRFHHFKDRTADAL